ncbi:hypothetical protein [Massilia genomosp. 1]|uniref:Helicase XPB/Ssl2 N-terminal domain-containing protein n=1 Tax=Massilia genomosp. 1 TaxID=2609280 RepID=A0ABX0N058_9BURK|nr:hypothetical protein [Massilia genomosp. 1]NHZ65287.1 hypothetical protein [Massilia genomosp. 1]
MNNLADALHGLTVDMLKQLLANFSDAKKVTRKDLLVAALLDDMSDTGLPRVWAMLDPCQQLAVREAAYDVQGRFDGKRFAAKYGQSPRFHHPGKSGSHRGPMNVLNLFLFEHDGSILLPAQLRLRVAALFPAPAPNFLTSLAALPELEQPAQDDDDDAPPLTQRNTAPDALYEVVAMLRMVDQKRISVSDKTRMPGVTALRAIEGKLANGDFYDATADCADVDQQIGAIKPVAWPLLLQASGLAELHGSKLGLTPAGIKALQAPPADVLRGIWRKWLSSTMFDEFNRVDAIKGQKGKGRLTPVAARRAIVGQFLQDCPAARWVEVDELGRFMRAEGAPLAVAKDPWSLYLEDPNYGALAYTDDEWDLFERRYLLCVLFEYCATLGMIDLAYRSPHNARPHFQELWGGQGMSFLSRYDGLMYVRLTGLGAYCLGLSPSYTAPAQAASCTLSVSASLQIGVTHGSLSAEDVLLLENWASRDSVNAWRLDREKTMLAVERGQDTAQLAAFLQSRDSQALPVQVEGFLRTCNKQGKAMRVLGASVLIECVDAGTADLIAEHKDTAALCMRAGKRHLAVLQSQEDKFRKAVRMLGYGIAP